ncbi:MAG: hypothetical protein JXR48_06745 [Candidatus Delongbacteria bacterium]|nr:hypothetical protein [Candidatus Delongbacteria bacterium]MBN2834649.1 hypothetical protein [Candidatus Delongbacteria bacterium]
MFEVDIEEIIRAMQDRTSHITYYLNRETGEIVHVDENVAAEVEQEYEEKDTVLEEWGVDMEDDDMFYEKTFAQTDDVNEKDLIKKIRYTNQDEFEPLEILTLKKTKKIFSNFISEAELDSEIEAEILAEIESLKDESEYEKMAHKYLGKKQEWIEYFHNKLVEQVKSWLRTAGLYGK